MCDPGDFPEGAAEWSAIEGVGLEEMRDTNVRDQKLIKAARQAEMKSFWEIPVYDYVPKAFAMSDSDGIIVDTTWVDVNKGTKNQPEWRSRLCAREFAALEERDDLFAPTPPLWTPSLHIY